MNEKTTDAARRMVFGEICLYGNSTVGIGWLAVAMPHGLTLGDGEPKADRGMTEAIWQAADAIQTFLPSRLPKSAHIWVYAPGGTRRAKIAAKGHVEIAGSLRWEPAPVIEISIEALLEAAKEGAR